MQPVSPTKQEFDDAKGTEFTQQCEALSREAHDAVLEVFKPESERVAKHASLLERSNHRRAVVEELTSTEDDYLNDLRIMTGVFS